MSFTGLPSEVVPAMMTGLITPRPAMNGRADAYLPSPCIQNHAANLAFLPDGTLSCVWFGGTMEGMGDISIYMSRLAPGAERWSEPDKMSDDPQKSEQNPLIFNAPDGKIWLLYTSQTSGNQDGSVVKCRTSDDGGKSFGPVSVLCDSPGTFVRQPLVVNGKGDWLLPVFRCVGRNGQRWSGDADTAAVLISRDGGASWRMHDIPDSIGAVHMNILPLGGDKMVAFYRNRFAESILSSRSSDSGETWSAPEPTELPNNNSSIQATILNDGAIAMVYNHSNASTSDARRQSLYDEIEGGETKEFTVVAADIGRKAVWGVPRAPLSLAISRDGGRSFPHRVDLDTGDGFCLSNNSKDSLNREFSYPSIIEGDDGTLHIAYTYYRRAIKYVRLAPQSLS
ncbi:putative neuraminidase (sialidase) [Rhizobium leguminosarum bv. trifolii WSM2297]|uniref:Putative neuraminidase (Sialidase) n=1 Tax=Rhizobium leguminosarum bv. trifolii WSM2297 TaxID=754762 RepID=J0L1G7_RHILT|nr:exo-alpha-sialidase [Rhizobium leguminosarum]EJC84019.1 putative neuraminidase (sialidase) [Rhizobium leguminosarum bv. trifolii WSM2297]EJC84390.1 putative neuraminidase (sialidase) [Rhizobium leguminosarum bv. trifolii WSM2297]